VLPALIRRFHEAKMREGLAQQVVIWGTGMPRREFLYVDDMADGCVFVMELDEATLTAELLSYPKPCFVNLGTGVDVTIRELAETVQATVGFEGQLEFDPSKPDGTMRKLLDVSRMQALGWQARVSLREGLERTYRWFLENQGLVRS